MTARDPWFAALESLFRLPPDERVQAIAEDPSLIDYVGTALFELGKAGQRDDWMRQQLDGLIEDAETVAYTTGLALARSVVGNLRAARSVVPEAADSHAHDGETT